MGIQIDTAFIGAMTAALTAVAGLIGVGVLIGKFFRPDANVRAENEVTLNVALLARITSLEAGYDGMRLAVMSCEARERTHYADMEAMRERLEDCEQKHEETAREMAAIRARLAVQEGE